MDTPDLSTIGLTPNQTRIYTFLVEHGPLCGADIATRTGISRQLTYKTLDELKTLGLIENIAPHGVARFDITHPDALDTLLAKRQQELATARKHLRVTIGDITSHYNLRRGKPGVAFFEGTDGVERALADTLTSTEEIYAFTDPPTINTYVGDINRAYVKKRLAAGISKRILSIDSPAMRTFLKDAQPSPLTHRRLFKNDDIIKAHAAIEIYDNKVVYMTFTNDRITTTVITDPAIYATQRYLFDFIWRNALAV